MAISKRRKRAAPYRDRPTPSRAAPNPRAACPNRAASLPRNTTKRAKRVNSCSRSRSNASSNSSRSSVVTTSGDENPRAGASREVADAPPGRRARPNAWRINDVRARDRPSRAKTIVRDPHGPPVTIDLRSVARDRAIENARDRAREATDVPGRRLPTIARSGRRDRVPVRGNPARVPETGEGTVDRAANRRA